jgi:diguanylate cyclase (GGDEF)-like protein
MDVELARASRHSYPLSLLLLDVDHFKAINDRFGHAGGDQVLAAIGALLNKSMRKTDLESRWGGEEFVLTLTSTELEGARITAERVRRDIESLSIQTGDGQVIAVTASIGVAVLRAGEPMVKLVDRADQAMYAAKVGGRNRVVVDTSTNPALASPTYDAATADPATEDPEADSSADDEPTGRRRALDSKTAAN